MMDAFEWLLLQLNWTPVITYDLLILFILYF